MKILKKLLNIIRRIVCLPVLMFIGLIAAPLTLLFNWQGIWILFIANLEGCSLEEAKKLLKEGKKYKIVRYNPGAWSASSGTAINNPQWSSNQPFSSISSSGINTDITSNPSYSYLSSNIYYGK